MQGRSLTHAPRKTPGVFCVAAVMFTLIAGAHSYAAPLPRFHIPSCMVRPDFTMPLANFSYSPCTSVGLREASFWAHFRAPFLLP